MKQNRIKISYLAIYFVVVLFSLFCAIPFLFVLIGSFTSEMAIMKNGFSLFPSELSMDAYKTIFAGNQLLNSYFITITVTAIGTAMSLMITSALAYGISVKSVAYRNKIAFFFYFTVLFNGGLLPWYIMCVNYLHLKDTIAALILPYLVNTWNMFLLRNFFKTIPDSIQESAKIDGASDIFIFYKIILPLAKPALATIGLFYALQYWNDWYLSLMFIDSQSLYPLQFLMKRLIDNINSIQQMFNSAAVTNVPSYGIRMSTCVITIGPIIFLYPFVQKYFIKGLTVGAVKG